MATLVISITSALGTTSVSKTFAGADAQRILSGFRKFTDSPTATQQDLTDYLKKQTLDGFKRWVNQNEVVVTTPIAPVFTSS